MSLSIARVTPERLPAIASMLGRAFAHDPMLRWPLRDTDEPAVQVGHYFRALNEGFVPLGVLWEAGDGLGAALWLPPGEAGRLAEIDLASRPKVHELTDDGGRRHDAFWDWIESRVPDEPLWFLDHLGVDPSRQGEGTGAALIEFGLERARADGTAAFLETGNPRNLAYYERFGFRVMEEGDAPLGGPHIWFMRCEPRAGGRFARPTERSSLDH